MTDLYKVLLIANCLYITLARQICVIGEGTNLCELDSCDVHTTIQELDQNPSENTTVLMCSSKITLDRLVHVKNATWLSIEGSGNSPVIVCNETNGGFNFVNVTNITLKGFEIQDCGANHNSTSKNTTIPENNAISRSSVSFLNSTNIRIFNVNISHSDGKGLSMVDTNGFIHIKKCKFEHNLIKNNRSDFPGGGGLYIEFSYCTPGGLSGEFCNEMGHENPLPHNSRWLIQGCTFKNNIASSPANVSYLQASKANFQGQGRGGGLCIILKGRAENNTMDLIDNKFVNNSATWGGGLYIMIQDSPRNNTICINHSKIEKNVAYLNGGGGIDAGFQVINDNLPISNHISFSDCNITENIAHHGGGALIYSGAITSHTKMDNKISFDECRWIRNGATTAAGINVSPHVWDTLKKEFLLSPSFKNCLFESNYIDNNLNYSSDSYNQLEGKGTFVTVGMNVHFEGTTNFTNNTDSALYVVSSIIEFAPNSEVHFERNTGNLGGAMCVLSLSSLKINDNSSFTFIGNKARQKGGAIYQYDYAISRSCFIQYVGNKTNNRKKAIHFNFERNKADSSNGMYAGDSIYTGTLKPCYTGCLQKNPGLYNTFRCIGNFSFDGNMKHQVSTIGKYSNLTRHRIKKIITPGDWLQLPVLKDEFQNTVNALYHVFINESKVNGVSITNEFTSNQYIRIYGHPGNKTIIRVETVDAWEIGVTYDVSMVECPPGFQLSEITLVSGKRSNFCECTTTSDSKLYNAIIVHCYENNFTAFMRIGFWLGYETNPIEQDLRSGYCPIGFCEYSLETNAIALPNTTNKTELDRIICGKRTGKMCAFCRQNLTSHYHNPEFQCRSNERCNLGFLLYLISEILPITFFFLMIIVFDISCTNGAINGLIFYFQVVYIAINISSGFVRCHSPLLQLTEVFNLVTGIFSLNFFIHKDLSFCLWKGAQTLDLIAFRYVTITYSLLLVLMLIAIVRVCNVRKLTQTIPKLCGREIETQSTIIQGLSGFLVICYSESAKVSLMILIPATVFTRNKSSTVALYNGELNYFQGKHLVYALPALLFLLVLGLGPPLLLLSYPLCYRVFGWLKIGESKFVKILCKCLPLEKFKPFYDSFQSCFKDEYRFFSGLYFVYRLIILLVFSITRSLTDSYTTLIIGFSLILCIHAVVQPYKKRWHNILDAYIFMTLIVLSILSFYMYRRALELANNDYTIHVACTIQTILLYVPLVYFILRLVRIAVLKVMQKTIEIRSRQKNCNNAAMNVREQELSESLLYDRRDLFAKEK